MQKRQQIGRKLAKVFLLQLGFISLAALSGVYAAKRVLEGILIQQALRDEAEHFWDHYRTDPSFPLPDTRNMKAYLWPGQNRQEVPSNLRELPAG
ncbi:MAG: sensor histidine kinase, partial [Methylotetracoccus sp.]|nr:sensor histidine kinase [Methylotetracoccus sp.]